MFNDSKKFSSFSFRSTLSASGRALTETARSLSERGSATRTVSRSLAERVWATRTMSRSLSEHGPITVGHFGPRVRQWPSPDRDSPVLVRTWLGHSDRVSVLGRTSLGHSDHVSVPVRAWSEPCSSTVGHFGPRVCQWPKSTICRSSSELGSATRTMSRSLSEPGPSHVRSLSVTSDHLSANGRALTETARSLSEHCRSAFGPRVGHLTICRSLRTISRSSLGHSDHFSVIVRTWLGQCPDTLGPCSDHVSVKSRPLGQTLGPCPNQARSVTR